MAEIEWGDEVIVRSRDGHVKFIVDIESKTFGRVELHFANGIVTEAKNVPSYLIDHFDTVRTMVLQPEKMEGNGVE